MARGRRRKSGSSTGLVLGAIACIVLSLGLVGGFLFLKMRAGAQEPLDKITLCPLSGPKAVTAVLMDVTDPISNTTATDLRNEFQVVVGNVPVGGLLQVYVLTEREGELVQTFSGCNPGDGHDVDEWTRNPRLVQERWEKGFQKPLDELSRRLPNGGSSQQSPIMAGIQKINLDAFSLPKYQNTTKTLIIASDMVEHTPAYSMYRAGASYANYEKSGVQAKFRTPLSRIDVRVLQFQRKNLLFTDEELGNFWNSWVSQNSGTLVSFRRLQGVM